ncbi:CPBP family intramembrane metalloprotease [Kribbella sandramycini]|uniref:CPBP family intramembrane metalloprotease n=1 Tax=Kribbella sandramycini TaxID=60450 RepID=A0A7Y4NYP6_9ACTN|nr:CPBP family intramembrane glutamic endopeptidase [Kribbella sandramycini]MBB6569402.1 membrane protease YdiL (CAAX protease family) [Kribbella sandramycini]NOL40761.1 CPBP family intramembrane metalloprotease [Kribbella sandramycini]
MDPQPGEPRPQDSPQPWAPPAQPPPPPVYGQPGPSSQPGPYPPYPAQPGQYPSPQGQPGQYPPPQGRPGLYPPYPGQQGQPGPYPGQYGQLQYGPGQHPQQPWAQPAPREPRVIPAAPGTPFHRLARTSTHRWWRPILGTLSLGVLVGCVTVGVFIVWLIVHTILGGAEPSGDVNGNEIFGNPTEDLALTLVMLGILIPLAPLVAWLLQRRPAWSVASVLNKIRWRWLALCCLPAFGYLVVSFGLGLLVDQLLPVTEAASEPDAWVGFAKFIGPALVIIFLVPFQSSAEEFVFRGWLIQAIGAYGPDSAEGRFRWLRLVFRSPWPGIVIGGAAFVSAHGYTGWAMLDIFLFAVVAGWLTVRTGGLEAAIALHVLNNLFAFLLPAATGGLDSWADQGGAPWTILLSDIPALAFVLFAVTWLANRKQVARVS